MGILSIAFGNEETLRHFQSLQGDLSFSIIPVLGENPQVTADDLFYRGEVKGVPYVVTYSPEAREKWSPDLGHFLMISTFCDPLPDGTPGHYYLWDRHQVIQVNRFSISVMVDGSGETTLVSSDTPIFFPVSKDHINHRETNSWSIVNIALEHTGEESNKGWSSTLSLINNKGVSVDPIVHGPSPTLTKRELLRMAARHNSRRGPSRYQVVEVDKHVHEIGAPKPKLPHVKKTMEEDGAEPD